MYGLVVMLTTATPKLHPSIQIVIYLDILPWEKDGIPDEKDGSVVTDQIPVALFSVEFNGEATRVTGGIG
jgi:hypothetical protein